MIKVVKMQFGSHVYGTNTPESDHDFKGIFIPDAKDLILQKAPRNINRDTNKDNTKNTKDDIDEEWFSMSEFIRLLLQGQTVALDMLFTPEEFYVELDEGTWGGFWNLLRKNKDKFIHSGTSSFAGYCQSQAAKYSLKGSNLAAFRLAKDFFASKPHNARVFEYLDEIEEKLIKVAKDEKKYHDKDTPIIKWTEIEDKQGNTMEYLQIGAKTKHATNIKCGLAAAIWTTQFDKYGDRARQAESNEGVDWKALMHAVRIAGEATELLNDEKITLPRPNKDLLLKIRNGEMDYKLVANLITRGLDELNDAKAMTLLPEEPDNEYAEKFVYAVYSKAIMDHFLLHGGHIDQP